MSIERDNTVEALQLMGSKIYLQMDMISNVYNQDLVNKFVLKTCKKNLELINCQLGLPAPDIDTSLQKFSYSPTYQQLNNNVKQAKSEEVGSKDQEDKPLSKDKKAETPKDEKQLKLQDFAKSDKFFEDYYKLKSKLLNN